jgi:uncharacterized protein YraI
VGVAADDRLNVRNGPSADYAVIGSLDARTRGVQVFGSCVLGWCQVRHRALLGWVNGLYLAEEATKRPAVATASVATQR